MKRLLWNKVPARGTALHVRRYIKSGSKQGGKNDDARMRWAIAEGHIPAQSSFSNPALVSHETACILNAGDAPAHVRIIVFFADRKPVGPYLVTVPPRRTLHLGFDDLERPAPIPRDTPYSSLFESDAPIVVQHTRLDSRHAEFSLLAMMAYGAIARRTVHNARLCVRLFPQ
jgi:hypothetical protein